MSDTWQKFYTESIANRHLSSRIVSRKTWVHQQQRIRILEERVEELEAAQRWIPVTERWPDDGETVLIPSLFGEVESAKYRGGRWYQHGQERVSLTGAPLPPEHWRDMPQPPEQESGDE